jgi:hypothetical protein
VCYFSSLPESALNLITRSSDFLHLGNARKSITQHCKKRPESSLALQPQYRRSSPARPRQKSKREALYQLRRIIKCLHLELRFITASQEFQLAIQMTVNILLSALCAFYSFYMMMYYLTRRRKIHAERANRFLMADKSASLNARNQTNNEAHEEYDEIGIY